MTPKYASVALLAGAALALCACGSKPPVITVGGKNTTEHLILGEMIAAHLEKQLPGVQIERKLGLGGAMAADGAMQSGAIDLYVEDVGAMMGTLLKENVPADVSIGMERARAQFEARFKVAVLKPLGFQHQFVVVRYAPMKAKTLSELAESGTAVRFGVAQDLTDRNDAFTALTTQYRISMRELPKQLDTPALYQALMSKTIDFVAGYSTDAWVGEPGFELMKDDLSLFTAQPNCILVREKALAGIPGLQKGLGSLSGKVTNEAMHRMNQAVDLKHRTPAEVAKEFLAGAGL